MTVSTDVRTDLYLQPPQSMRVVWHPFREEFLSSLDELALDEEANFLDHARIIREKANRTTKEVSAGVKAPTRWTDIEATLGAALYRSVLREERTREKFWDAYNLAIETSKTFHIEINPKHEPLAALPWELIQPEEIPSFEPLALSFDTPLIRRAGNLNRPWHIQEPVKILVASASPMGQPPPNIDQEYHLISSILENSESLAGRFDLINPPLRNASLSRLGDKLRNTTPHLLHLIAHGEPGSIELEDDLSPQGRAIPADQLISVIRHNHPDLMMFITTACESAAFPNSGRKFSIAHALSQAGIPVVIGMQFEMSEEATAIFVEKLYTYLGGSNDVPTSVTAARQELRRSRPRSAEWAAPVLYRAHSSEDILFVPIVNLTLQNLTTYLQVLKAILPQIQGSTKPPQGAVLDRLSQCLIDAQKSFDDLDTYWADVLLKERLTEDVMSTKEQCAGLLKISMYMSNALYERNKYNLPLQPAFFDYRVEIPTQLSQVISALQRFLSRFTQM